MRKMYQIQTREERSVVKYHSDFVLILQSFTRKRSINCTYKLNRIAKYF